MQIGWSVVVALGLAACTSGSGKGAEEPAPPVKVRVTKGCPPPEFDVAELAKGSLGVEPQPKVKTLRVLAWQESVRADHFLYLDEALVLIETQRNGFVLAHIAHNDDPGWSPVSTRDERRYPATETFQAAPDHDDVERFLNKVAWTWAPRSNFERLAAGVCSDAWTESFGQPAWHEIESPPAT